MGEFRRQFDEDFRKNAVKLSYASPKTIREIAEDLGIHENLLYNWRRKYTEGGDKPKYATLEEENRDLRRERVLGDHMADRMTKEPVINAVLARHRLEEGCIFHSDRDSQYTSNAVMDLLRQYGLRQRFSRVGMPGDSTWVEASLKQ